MSNKVGIIIEARMNSSRLPGKVLMKHNGNEMLKIMVLRLKKSKKCKNIIIATTKNKKDNRIIKLTKKLKINYFRGSEKNVLERVINSAKKFNLSTIIKICGDCPLIDPKILDKMLSKYNRSKVDYLSNNLIKSYPDGMDIEMFDIKTLEKSYSISKSVLNKEHVTYFIKKSKRFKKINFKAPKKSFYPKLRVTLDNYRDFKFISNILSSFNDNIYFSNDEMIKSFKSKRIKIEN